MFALAEFEGRHPCVVDHAGHPLSFVGEAAQELKDTGAKKARQKTTAPREKSNARPALPKPREITPEPDSDMDTSTGEKSDSGTTDQPATHFVPAGRTSPSGNFTKRARVAGPPGPVASFDLAADARPVNPMPSRAIANDKKRKRPDVPSPTKARPRQQGPPAEPGPHMLWPNQTLPGRTGRPEAVNEGGVPHPAMHSTTPMYPPPGFGAPPFGFQPPYGPHAGFVGPQYAPPGYAPQYGPPSWVPPPQHGTQPNQQPQWAQGQSQFHPEDFEAMMQMRQSGYQG